MTETSGDRFVVADLMAISATELAEHAFALSTDIRSGKYGPDGSSSLLVVLGHLMDHLVDIWHLSRMSDAAFEAETQEEYERRCLKIPRLQEGYEWVDVD